MEIWDEAAEFDAYIRNQTDTGPIIDGSVVSPEEAWTGKTPSIDHIRVWGSACVSYLNPKTIPAGQCTDKLVDRGRDGVFMGYSETTHKQQKVYSPELGYTFWTSRCKVFENTPGSVLGEHTSILLCVQMPTGLATRAQGRVSQGVWQYSMAVRSHGQARDKDQ